jgi:hypothetical protein
MTDKPAYELGARKPMTKDTPDANDKFSQKAAENRKPPLGIGIAEKVDKPKEKRLQPKKPTRDTRESPAPNPDGDAQQPKK